MVFLWQRVSGGGGDNDSMVEAVGVAVEGGGGKRMSYIQILITNSVIIK